ncbi:MAG: AraC family transcriptional regulator [Polyangiales bacterium]
MSHDAEEHTFPAVHVLHLIDLVKRWDVTSEQLLAGVGLEAASLSAPAARVSVDVLVALVERARVLTAEPALGVYFGLQMRVSTHGYVGFAAMTASTVREALELAVRYAPTRTTAVSLRLVVEGRAASVVIDEHADFGSARDVVVLALLVGIWQIGNALTGRELTGQAELAFPAPSWFPRFAGTIDVRFGQPNNRLVFDAAFLELPLTMADREAMQLARDQCERALEALGIDGRVVPRVRNALSRDEGMPRSLDDVAAALHVSPRTLKRKLAAEGAAYSTLLEEHRREKALLLLRSRDLTVDAVAERLGYSDVTSFSRAFRRWTGTTPAAYRRS